MIGLTRGRPGADRVAALGARAVVADALDRDSLLRAVDGLAADAVIHELTALKKPPLRHGGMAVTDRLRSEGTANLLAAAEPLDARRFLTQSFILGYGYFDHGDRVLTEQDPFGRLAGDRSDPHVAAMRSAEQQTFTAPEGIALRYGLLYGGDADEMRALLAKRGVPVAAGGVLGWVSPRLTSPRLWSAPRCASLMPRPRLNSGGTRRSPPTTTGSGPRPLPRRQVARPAGPERGAIGCSRYGPSPSDAGEGVGHRRVPVRRRGAAGLLSGGVVVGRRVTRAQYSSLHGSFRPGC